MLVVHGTRKFLDRVGRPSATPDDRSTTLLGSWYATVRFWRPQVARRVNEEIPDTASGRLRLVELRTERLVIRPATTADAQPIQEYRGDRGVVTYLTHPALDLDQVRQLLAEATAMWSSVDNVRFNLLFAVVSDGAVIGDVRAWNMTELLSPESPEPGEVWISYAFNPRHQGRGYATEAVRSILTWLFARGTSAVFANCYLDNTSSIRLLGGLNFTEYIRFSADADTSGKHMPSCRMRRMRSADESAQ